MFLSQTSYLKVAHLWRLVKGRAEVFLKKNLRFCLTGRQGGLPPAGDVKKKVCARAKKKTPFGVVGLFPAEAHSGVLLVAEPKLLIPKANSLAAIELNKPALTIARGSGDNALLTSHGLDSIS